MSQREVPDYYAALQVLPTAEPVVIEAAYRSLARQYHPDMNDAPDAGARMQALNDAYAILRDPKRRAEYDAGRAKRGRWGAHLAELHLDGEWYVFRIGEAADAFRTIAALEAAIPLEARRWDSTTQLWSVHAGHADTLGQLFVDFGAPAGQPLRLTHQADAEQAWPYMVAVAVCLTALAIIVYLAQSETVVTWRHQVGSTLSAVTDRVDPAISLNLAVVFVAAIAALVLGYIAWTLRRPSP